MIRIFCVQLSFLSLSHHHVPVIPTNLLCHSTNWPLKKCSTKQVLDIFQVIYDAK